MFGRIRKKREKKKRKEAQKEAERKKMQEEAAKAQEPGPIVEELKETQEQVQDLDKENQPYRDEQREKHKEEAMQDVTTEVPGLSENEKAAMRQSANAQIDSQVQNYQRALASQQSRAGARGGTADAAQRAIFQQGLNAQNQFQRDLVEKDSDVARSKLAAYLASLEGKSAEEILRLQQYYDYITGRQAQKAQGVQSDYYGKDYKKV